jgi:hypothetical protein
MHQTLSRAVAARAVTLTVADHRHGGEPMTLDFASESERERALHQIARTVTNARLVTTADRLDVYPLSAEQ